MTGEHPHPTPEQARTQLAASRAASLGSDGDRTVHALATVAFGLVVGLYLSARNVVDGAGSVVASVLFFGCWLTAALWVERSTSTVPRRAKLWSRLGLAGSMLVALLAVLPWLNLQAQDEPNTWPMVLAGALVATLPSALAAAAIARARP